jgi:hypothetical protein
MFGQYSMSFWLILVMGFCLYLILVGLALSSFRVVGKADDRMNDMMAMFIERQQSRASQPIQISSPKLPSVKPSDSKRNRLFTRSPVRHPVPRWAIFLAFLAGSGLLFRIQSQIKRPSLSS